MKKNLRHDYEEKNAIYLKVKKQSKEKETELKRLQDEQKKLGRAESASKELGKNIKKYNEVAPKDFCFQVDDENITVETFLTVQTKVYSYLGKLKKEQQVLRKKESALEEYLVRNGEKFKTLQNELKQKQEEYNRCHIKLQERIAYEVLKNKFKLAQKDKLKLDEEVEILEYVLQNGKAAMDEKQKWFYWTQTRLPEQEKTLEEISGQLACLNSLQEKQIKVIEQFENEREKEAKLLDIAKQQDELEAEKADVLENIAQKCEVEKSLKETQQKIQKKYNQLNNYTLPCVIEQYAKYKIPEEDEMVYYTGRLNNLLQQWNKVEYDREEYEKQLRDAKTTERKISWIVEEGRKFLEEHPTECSCPLCHTQFKDWNALYGATLELKNSQKKGLEQMAARLEQDNAQIKRTYDEILEQWTTERIASIERLTTDCAKLAENLAEVEKERKCAERTVLCLENKQQKNFTQAIRIGWSKEKKLTVSNVEIFVNISEKQREEKLQQAVYQKTALEEKKEKLQKDKDQSKQLIRKLKNLKAEIEKEPLYEKSILYLQETLMDFQANEKKNEVENALKKKNEEILQLQREMANLYSVSATERAVCEKEKNEAVNELSKTKKMYDELCVLVQMDAPTLDVLEREKKEAEENQKSIEDLLERLGEIQFSGGMIEGIKEYKNNEMRIRSMNRKIEEKKDELKIAKQSVDQAEKKLLSKLQDYFSQPLFNEIYQKIDPHPYMKNVTYRINYNEEKEEPELYIEACTEDQEPYHPEWFFSTAQLNTVALSSFLSRALSLTNLPIGTILIDDPVGHFDDMNILGFADLMRSIIEKSGKQIVITTHDETVYQIFRRKLPPEKYNSRFIDMTSM